MRTKWFIVTTVFGPVLLAAVMILPAWMSMRSMRDARVGRVEILDATGVGLGRAIQFRLLGGASADTGGVTVRELEPGAVAAAESLATGAVMQDSLSGYLVVDSGTVAGQSARYAGRNASSVGGLERIETAIRQAVLAGRLEAEGLDPGRIDALTRVRVQMSSERITDKGRGGSGRGAVVLGFIVAFLLYMSLMLYGQNMLRSVLEEKTTRVAEVIVSSIKTDVLLAGKVLGVAAVGLTQQVAWIGSAALLWKTRVRIFSAMGLPDAGAIPLPHVSLGLIALYLMFFVLGFVFYSSLFAAAGATVNSDQEAGQASQPIIMLLVFSILFLQPVMLSPDSTMASVLSWLPFSAPIVMPLRMSVVSVSAIELTAVLVGLTASCAAAIWVSARIYRVGLLMYGKRPSFRELGRWILQA
jgi:ABC-2 type transport system permease protein